MIKDLAWLKEEVQELLLQDKLNGINYFDYKRLKEDIWGKIDQIEQPTPPNSTGLELPVVPGYVGEHVQKCMLENLSLFNAMEASYEYSDQTARFLFDGTQENNAVNQRKFAVAYLFGYTTEEKKYEVHLPSVRSGDYSLLDIYGNVYRDSYPEAEYQMTESEINNIDPKYMAFAVPIDEVRE